MSGGAASVRAAWRRLDPRLRAFWWVNLAGQWAAILALAATYLVGVPHEQMRADLAVMAASGLTLLGSVPFVLRRGAPAAVYGVLLSTSVFALGAVWVTPFLGPLVVLVVLVPVMVAYPYLGRRSMRLATLLVMLEAAALAGLSQWRQDVVDPPHRVVATASLVAFTPFVVAVIAYAVGQSYRQLAAQADELRASRTRIAAVADAARRGLERDLHDGAQQRLVGMSVTIGRATALVEAGRTDDALAVLEALGEQNLAAVQELRELARGIYPPLLAERGLVAAVTAAARRSSLPCTVLASPVPRLEQSVEAAVYFCILEALQNAAKHSGAAQVQVRLRAEPHLEFAVVDEGAGFDPARVAADGGLLGMDARVRAAGGRLLVESAPGVGTTVRGVFDLA